MSSRWWVEVSCDRPFWLLGLPARNQSTGVAACLTIDIMLQGWCRSPPTPMRLPLAVRLLHAAVAVQVHPVRRQRGLQQALPSGTACLHEPPFRAATYQC